VEEVVISAGRRRRHSGGAEAIADRRAFYQTVNTDDHEDLTKKDVEGLRGELFHMILSLWLALIGEYLLNFRDYSSAQACIAGGRIPCSIFHKVFNLEDGLRDKVAAGRDAKEIKRDRSYELILVFEGMAILVTWILLLKLHHKSWLISCFALIAGCIFSFGKADPSELLLLLGPGSVSWLWPATCCSLQD